MSIKCLLRSRVLAPSLFAMLSGYAAAQSNTNGEVVATVVDVPSVQSTTQQNNYNLYGDNNVATLQSLDATVANYGASASCNETGVVGALTAKATASQPMNGLTNYAESRAQSTITDLGAVTGPEADGTPVTLTLWMVINGTYPSPDANLEGNLAYAGASLGYQIGGDSGSATGSNEAGKSLSPLSITFTTQIGAQIQLDYGLDAWVYVNGVNPLGTTETVDLSTGGIYVNSSLSGVTIVDHSGYTYAATPTPPGFAVLGIGLIGLLVRRRQVATQ